MANRNTLHISKVPEFKAWLKINDWELQDPKGTYEEIRAKKGKRTFLAFRGQSTQHLTVMDKDMDVVKEFIMFLRRTGNEKKEMTALEALNALREASVMVLSDRETFIDAIAVGLKTLEKRVPMEITAEHWPEVSESESTIECPICGISLWAEDWKDYNFCHKCGQAIKIKEKSECQI